MIKKRIRIWPFIACIVLVIIFSCAHPFKANGADHYTAESREESSRILLEIASSVYYPGRYEVRITGRGFAPPTLILAQMFPDIIDISNTVIDDRIADGMRYITADIGFTYRLRKEDCSHEWERKVLLEPGCVREGRASISCILCGEGRESVIAASGHTDENRDGICDTCGESLTGEVPAGKDEWAVGDILERKIGDKYFSFRCVDDDYRASDADGRRLALFLCETVIRSDTVFPGERPLKFGEDNNYKRSEPHAWLEENASDDGIGRISVGVDTAYTGKTADGAFGEMRIQDLSAVNISKPQYLTAGMFLLSVGEAFRYRAHIYNVPGGEGTYERVYWLRTPVYEEDGDGNFTYGLLAYTVDLDAGCIRPWNVNDTTPGIRPVFCLPQE